MKQSSFVRSSMVRLTVAAAVVAVALAGCAAPAPIASPPATDAPSASPTPTPTPTPTQQAETGLEAPSQIFDGACANIATDADASALLGSAVTLYVPDYFFGVDSTRERIVGGIDCKWFSKEFDVAINLDAVPEKAAPVVDGSNDCGPGRLEGYGEQTCMFDFAASGIRFAGYVYARGTSKTEKAAADLKTMLTRLAADQTVIVPIPAAEAWANPVNCKALDAALANDFLADGTQARLFQGGGDVYFSPIFFDLSGMYEGYGTCSWEAKRKGKDSLYVTANPLGGAAFLEEDLIASGDFVSIEMEGVDSVYDRIDDYSQVDLFVFDGPNLLEVRGLEGDANSERVRSVVTALLAAMNDL